MRQVAEMGYRSVEFAGFFGHSAQEIKGWLDKYGLTASGTHTGMSELTGDKLQETIAYHQAIGCQNLIVPYESFATKGEIDAFIQRVQQVEPQLNAAGITLHYHNHDHEFKPNQDGLIPEEELLARTNLLLEVDTYWVYAAGKDRWPSSRSTRTASGSSTSRTARAGTPAPRWARASPRWPGAPGRHPAGPGRWWWKARAWSHRPGGGPALHGLPAQRGPEGRQLRSRPAGGKKRKPGAASASGFCLPGKSGFLGGQADEVLPSFHAAGAEDFHIPALLAVAEHKGRGQGAAGFPPSPGVEGEQLVPPLDLVAHFGEALEAVALQFVGVHAHVDEELYASAVPRPRACLVERANSTRASAGAKSSHPSGKMTTPGPRISWAKVGSGHWETGATSPDMGQPNRVLFPSGAAGIAFLLSAKDESDFSNCNSISKITIKIVQ